MCIRDSDGTGTDRTILSGIHSYYEPEELVGKTLIAITNLPPRKMMGIESCGMLLSAVNNLKDSGRFPALFGAAVALQALQVAQPGIEGVGSFVAVADVGIEQDMICLLYTSCVAAQVLSERRSGEAEL